MRAEAGQGTGARCWAGCELGQPRGPGPINWTLVHPGQESQCSPDIRGHSRAGLGLSSGCWGLAPKTLTTQLPSSPSLAQALTYFSSLFSKSAGLPF